MAKKTVKQKEKRKLGRPSLYDRADKKKILAMMAEGASITEVAADIGVHRDTIYAWREKFPEFSDTLKMGEMLSQAWWESQGRTNLVNPKFQAALWYMNMKNRFGWRDKPSEGDDDYTVAPVKVVVNVLDASKTPDAIP